MTNREKRKRASRVRLCWAIIIGCPLALMYALYIMEALHRGAFYW